MPMCPRPAFMIAKTRTEDSPTFRVRCHGALFKQIGVRPGSFQEQNIFVNSIDQEPVRFDMAFPVLVPMPGQMMISMSDGQRLSRLSQIDNSFKFIQINAAFCGSCYVSEETGGRFHGEHDLRTGTMSKGAEDFRGGEFPRAIGFFTRSQRGGVRDFHGNSTCA